MAGGWCEVCTLQLSMAIGYCSEQDNTVASRLRLESLGLDSTNLGPPNFRSINLVLGLVYVQFNLSLWSV